MKKAITICLVLLIAGLAFAQDKATTPPSKDDMNQMMAAYEKLAAPGPEHAILAKMAGEWVSSSKMWMDPKQPPMETKGTHSGEMILGGRYLATVDKGDMMGKPMEGHSIIGFDKFKKKFLMTWIDNMGTSILTGEGTLSADNKVITLTGTMDEPMSGEKNKPTKYVFTLVDDKTYKFQMYDQVGTPKEFVAMEDTYTKK